MAEWKCGKCDAPVAFMSRCEKHQRCDDCGSRKNLISGMTRFECRDCAEKRVEKEIADFEGNTDFTTEIICPHCGHEHGDSLEHPDAADAFECHNCDRTFKMVRDIEVTYCTEEVLDA